MPTSSKMISRVNILLDAENPFQVIPVIYPNKNYVFKGDQHYALQVCIVIKGGMEVIYPDCPDFKLKIGAGQIYWASSWEPHMSRITKPNTYVAAISFLPESFGDTNCFNEFFWFEPFLMPLKKRPWIRGKKNRDQITNLAKQILQLSESKGFGEKTMVWLKIHELILLSMQIYYRENPDIAKNRPAQNEFVKIYPAIEMIRNKVSVSVEEAAKKCGLSRSRFSCVFSKLMGISYNKFSQRTRIFSAASSLKNTSLSIKEIARECGFDNLSHFYHLFNTYFNSTPAEYRYSKFKEE